jgi:putative membrane protein
MRTRRRSIWKGALAGLVGGLAGAAAKAYAEKIYSARLVEAQYALTPSRPVGSSASLAEAPVSPTLVPWVFGGLAGAAYGAAVETEPTAAAWQGAAFGLAIGRVASAVPMAGLDPSGTTRATEPGKSNRVTHAIYGVVTELVRRPVRRGLD